MSPCLDGIPRMSQRFKGNYFILTFYDCKKMFQLHFPTPYLHIRVVLSPTRCPTTLLLECWDIFGILPKC